MLGPPPLPSPSLGSMAISLPSVHRQTQRFSLSRSLRCAEGALCLSAAGGNSVPFTALPPSGCAERTQDKSHFPWKESPHTHLQRSRDTTHFFMCTHTHPSTHPHTHTRTHTLAQPVSWQDLFTLETVTLSLGKAGVKPSCLVQRDTRRQTSTVRPKDFYLLWSITD